MDYISVTESGCHEWTASRFQSGYGRMKIAGKTYRAHRVIWECAHGEIPEGQNVLHHCDNRACVRLDHLFLGTHDDNMADMVSKDRGARERNRHARLSRAQVEEIRVRYAAGGVTQAVLADEYGVTQTAVSNLVLGKTWGRERRPSTRAKLTDEQVSEVRERFDAGGTSQGRLAKEYGVSQALVSQIVRGLHRPDTY